MNTQTWQKFTGLEHLRLTALRALLIFAIISIVITPIFYGFHLMTQSTVDKALREEEMLKITVIAEQITSSFQNSWADAKYLASSRTLVSYLQGSQDYETAAEDFLNFARNHRIYDQIRFINLQGDEDIRINRQNGDAVIEKREALQNKASRYYVQESMKLERGDLYLSPMDLNIENGKIEEPYRPMIRIGAPVFDDQGSRRGALVLNLHGRHILDFLSILAGRSARQVMLVNGDGYYLKSGNPGDDWGFMFPEKKQTGFAWSHAGAWQKMLGESQGQFFIDSGLYTYSYIDPRLFEFSVLEGTRSPLSVFDNPGEGYPLKLISFYQADSYKVLLWNSTRELFLVYFVTLAVFLVFSIIIARFLVAQLENRRMNEFLALHDTLTGLPTRRLFYDRLETALKLVRRSRKLLAVLFLDLDNFKDLNDSAGHEAGDILLVEVAQRIQKSLRASDTVARLGGDEFVVLLDDVDNREVLRLVAEKILSAMRQPCTIRGKEVVVSVSIGAAMAPGEAETVDDIIRIADEEMYKAKRAGKNQVTIR